MGWHEGIFSRTGKVLVRTLGFLPPHIVPQGLLSKEKVRLRFTWSTEWGSMLNKAITLSLLSGSVLFCTVGVLLRKLEGGLRGISHVIVVSLYRSQLIAYFYYEFIPSCREEDGPFTGFSVTLLWGPISKHSRDITVLVTSWLKISQLY